MEPAEYLALRVPADALGLSAAQHAALLDSLLDEAVSVTENAAARRAWALGELYGLEAAFISRQLSGGSGAEGSFSYSDVSARLARVTADRDAARAEFARLTTPDTPRGAVRGSGSVKIVVEG
ncbi:hypothetical protein DEIPH_ctg011orf0016 [Deinococcus phoenicis]|uniref:Uncharacterized protein n=1 Tax=Deinococcus phoenicis TaxID=1476583 RepID=A0A016QT74_9DEIO|nr:hypothetical protein [Deinococcus phoenicis]EYB69052.1 hypothetical protein DEIPH_ctg011orf0016 [Deinococcus phoenicis]